MASHTPGPYIACNGCEIRTPDGKWVSDAWNSCDANTSEYNAKLLAAAPDLLAALEAEREFLDGLVIAVAALVPAGEMARLTASITERSNAISAAIRAARGE